MTKARTVMRNERFASSPSKLIRTPSTYMEIVKKLTNCPRCNGTHLNIGFKAFTQPIDVYTHYSLCPVNHEPILMRIVKENK